MATPFNLTEATTDPEVLNTSANITPTTEKQYVKTIENQGWAMMQSLMFIQMYRDGLRDPEYLAGIMASSLSSAINQGDSNSDSLDSFYTESVERRTELELDLIDEDLYKQERDPRLLTNLIETLLASRGMETEFQDDLTTTTRPQETVEVTDPMVRQIWSEGGTSSQQSVAEAIASKLGLEVEHSDDELLNLVIPEITPVDSTDPYIKTVVGS